MPGTNKEQDLAALERIAAQLKGPTPPDATTCSAWGDVISEAVARLRVRPGDVPPVPANG